VISASAEASWEAVGESGFGVGGARSGTEEIDDLAVLLRLRGDATFAGELASAFRVVSASRSSLGSAEAAGVGAFLGRPLGFGAAAGAGAGVVDLRERVCLRGAGFSGSKSSSSSWTLERLETSSSSSESIMAVRLVARLGRTGEAIVKE